MYEGEFLVGRKHGKAVFAVKNGSRYDIKILLFWLICILYLIFSRVVETNKTKDLKETSEMANEMAKDCGHIRMEIVCV